MLTGSYNHSVDFWSLGISIFFMLTSEFPFKEIEGNESFTWEHSTIYSELPDLNEKRKLAVPDSQSISDIGCNFVTKLLNKDPIQRLGSRTNPENIKDHPFFNSMDWIKLEAGELVPPINPDVNFFDCLNLSNIFFVKFFIFQKEFSA